VHQDVFKYAFFVYMLFLVLVCRLSLCENRFFRARSLENGRNAQFIGTPSGSAPVYIIFYDLFACRRSDVMQTVHNLLFFSKYFYSSMFPETS
jgi:hypothetical protein